MNNARVRINKIESLVLIIMKLILTKSRDMSAASFRLLLGICFLFLLQACKNDPFEVSLDSVDSKVEVKRFDQAFFDCDRKNPDTCIFTLKSEFSPFFQQGDRRFWRLQRNDSLLNSLSRKAKTIEDQFEDALELAVDVLKRYKYYYPKAPNHTVYTYLSPLDFEFPLFIADSLVFIALDQYLSSTSTFYASRPSYQSFRKDSKFISLDLAEELARMHNLRNQDTRDLLSDMIYEGKLVYMSRALEPYRAENDYLRYSKEDWEFCMANEADIWSYLIEQNLLFSSDEDVKRRLILPAPFSKFYLPIDAESPGEIGRWVGYRIICSLMENEDMSLQEMMQLKDARWILKNARYKP